MLLGESRFRGKVLINFINTLPLTLLYNKDGSISIINIFNDCHSLLAIQFDFVYNFNRKYRSKHIKFDIALCINKK